MRRTATRARGRMASALSEAQARLQPEAYERLEEHLLGGTSADWLAQTLTDNGIQIGATTIKAHRRRQTEGSV